MPRDPANARRLGWLLVGTLFGLALLLALPERQAPVAARERTASAGSSSITTGTAGESVRAPSPAEHAAAIATARVTSAVFAIERGQDLHAFATSVRDAAADGDPEAQYALGFVLRYCAPAVPRYADRAAFEEFLRTVPARSGIDPELYAALQRQEFEACDGFRADPLAGFGEFQDWLARAAAGGQPLAALELQLPHDPSAPRSEREALRRLARSALASGRPEALMMMYGLEFPAQGEPGERDAVSRAMAWQLLACRRGYPCGPDVRWRREQLAFRGGQRADLGWEDALLYDLEPYEREQARERADELAQALDSGELDPILPLTLDEPPP